MARLGEPFLNGTEQPIGDAALSCLRALLGEPANDRFSFTGGGNDAANGLATIGGVATKATVDRPGGIDALVGRSAPGKGPRTVKAGAPLVSGAAKGPGDSGTAKGSDGPLGHMAFGEGAGDSERRKRG